MPVPAFIGTVASGVSPIYGVSVPRNCTYTCTGWLNDESVLPSGPIAVTFIDTVRAAAVLGSLVVIVPGLVGVTSSIWSACVPVIGARVSVQAATAARRMIAFIVRTPDG